MRASAAILACIVSLLNGAAAVALDPTLPASIRYVVHNEAGQPIPDAKVVLQRSSAPDDRGESLITDAQGVVSFERPMRPYDDITWIDIGSVAKSGFVPANLGTREFPGARIETTIILHPERITTILVTGPGGQPAIAAPVTIQYPDSLPTGARITRTLSAPLHTDEHGRFRWVHGPIDGSFKVQVGDKSVISPEVDQINIALSADQFEHYSNAHPLRGKLILPDGKPAAGWLVCPEAQRIDGFGTSLGVPMETYLVDEWQLIGADGTFSSEFPAKSLVVLTPQGLPSVYALNPESWPPGPHDLTLTTPAPRTTMGGQLVDDKDSPLTNFPLYPMAMQGAGRRWRVNAGSSNSVSAVDSSLPTGPQPGRIVTDAAGNFSVSLYAGMELDELTAGDFSAYWEWDAIGGIADQARTVVTRRDFFSPSEARKLKDITVRFVDDSGKQIEAPSVDGPAERDDRGQHFFVDKALTRITVTTQAGTWRAQNRVFSLSGTSDQTVEFRLDDSQRMPTAAAPDPASAVKANPTTATAQPRRINSATTQKSTSAATWNTLAVTVAGKPAVGAEVAVFTGPDNGIPVTIDLADAQGKIRFRAEPGRQYAAAARIRGQCAGIEVFTAADASPASPLHTIATRPVRTLAIRYLPWTGSLDFSLRITEPDAALRQMMVRLLGNDDRWGQPSSVGRDLPLTADVRLQHDSGNSYFAEGIPIGTRFTIESLGNGPTETVTVEPGNGPQEAEFGAAAPIAPPTTYPAERAGSVIEQMQARRLRELGQTTRPANR